MARPSTLHVPAFSGGVVRLGSTDAQQVTELAACEKFDIGDRGQLVLASDLSDYTTVRDQLGAGALGVRHRQRDLRGDERLAVAIVRVAIGPYLTYLLSTPAPDNAAATINSTPA
jgi:hypothetical protein